MQITVSTIATAGMPLASRLGSAGQLSETVRAKHAALCDPS